MCRKKEEETEEEIRGTWQRTVVTMYEVKKQKKKGRKYNKQVLVRKWIMNCGRVVWEPTLCRHGDSDSCPEKYGQKIDEKENAVFKSIYYNLN